MSGHENCTLSVAHQRAERLHSMSHSICTGSSSSSLVFTGWKEISQLQAMLTVAYRSVGAKVVFDPASDPGLRDYLTVGTMDAFQQAALYSLIGGLLGLLFGNVRAGMALGTAVGAVTGVARGVASVDAGWRVRVEWAANGVPLAQVNRLGRASRP